MDMKALRRIVRARWWILVLAAFAAVVISDRLSDYRDANLPEAEAITWVTFIEDPTALERGEFVDLLEVQFAQAQTVNSDVLNETPGAFIPWPLAEIDLELDQNQIQFVGRGETEAEAVELATALRDRFLASSTIGAGRDRISRELDSLTVQIGELRAEIAQSQDVEALTPERVELEARRLALTSRIDGLRGHYSALGVELINPVLRTGDVIIAEMERTLADVVALEQELAQFPPITPEVDPAEDLDSLLDQLQLGNLEQRWQSLYQSERALDALSSTGEVETQPISVAAPSDLSNSTLAVFAALVVAMVALVVYERLRGVVWAPSDIDERPAVFIEMAPRGLRLFDRPTDQPWYLSSSRGRRKAAVQNLRGALEDYHDAVVAFQGTGVHQVDIRELAADVAVATAVSGRRVLLLDVGFNKKTFISEYGPLSGSTLADLLGAEPDGGDLFAFYKSALTSQDELTHGLTTLRAGEIDTDAADALSRSRFEVFLEVAKELYDLVIVAGVDIENPASLVVASRVDGVIAVGAVGRTLAISIETAERDLATRNASLVGAVLMKQRRTKPGRWFSYRFRSIVFSLVDRFKAAQARRGQDG